MYDEFTPLHFCTTGPDYITVRSRLSYIPLDLLTILPRIPLIARDLVISPADLGESTHIISLLRGELDDAQAARVEKVLKDKGIVGVQISLYATAARESTPSPSGDSDAYYASSALLALRDTSMQSPEEELPSAAELTR